MWWKKTRWNQRVECRISQIIPKEKNRMKEKNGSTLKKAIIQGKSLNGIDYGRLEKGWSQLNKHERGLFFVKLLKTWNSENEKRKNRGPAVSLIFFFLLFFPTVRYRNHSSHRIADGYKLLETICLLSSTGCSDTRTEGDIKLLTKSFGLFMTFRLYVYSPQNNRAALDDELASLLAFF